MCGAIKKKNSIDTLVPVLFYQNQTCSLIKVITSNQPITQTQVRAITKPRLPQLTERTCREMLQSGDEEEIVCKKKKFQ